MTNEELIVMGSLIGELRIKRHDMDDSVQQYSRVVKVCDELNETIAKKDKEYSSLCLECNRLRQREADALIAAEEVKAELLHTQEERDEARRKLGALTLCVGFLKDYDTRHPKKSMEAFKAAVKKCIDDNHIVLTEGGMAK